MTKAPFVEPDPLNPDVPTVDAPLSQDIGHSTRPDVEPIINEPMTLLRSETLAWHRFKQVVKTEDVSIGYDMSVREFECSTIHDLFKALTYIFCPY